MTKVDSDPHLLFDSPAPHSCLQPLTPPPPSALHSSSTLSSVPPTNMVQVHNSDEESPLSAVDADPSHAAMAELSLKEKALLEREACLNEKIDASLRDNIDRDPRAVWLLYIFQLLSSFAATIFFGTAVAYLTLVVNEDSFRSFSNVYGHLWNLMIILGAVLSDSYFGKWWTLLSGAVIFLAAMVTAAVLVSPPGQNNISIIVAALPMMLAAIANGLVRPTIQAFLGDQFLAVQERGITRSFSLLYFAFSLGSMISQHVLRAFMYLNDGWSDGFPTNIPIVASCSAVALLSILLIGRRRFRTVLPMREFVPFKLVKTTVVAARRFFSASPAERASTGHWLNFAAKDEGSLFVQEVYDFGLSMAHILLPYFFLLALAFHIDHFQTSETRGYVRRDTDIYVRWESYINMYGTLVLLLFATFVVYPIMERRGWSVSPHRRFGAGYVCVFVAFMLSLIVNKIAKDAYEASLPSLFYPEEPQEDADEGLYGRPCNSCTSQWATIPQRLLLVLFYVLVTPASIHIVYVETGPRLRTLAIAILFLIEAWARQSAYDFDALSGESFAGRHGLFGGLAAVGFAMFLVILRKYTPRKLRTSINDAARLTKHAEYDKI
ncbi:hypothetical protein DFQ27_007105 [Actinomortierella ambigua]|uniref:Uncharacterized protein n=1 Tax=Actinomortierella ambigua TaxID=1343610 RepID=A0A9P6U041_9FUNG|nr:hypothetical protein DFQ27_007105 [Actinomortierella ambigua]